VRADMLLLVTNSCGAAIDPWGGSGAECIWSAAMVRKGTIGIEWINSYHGRATNLRHTGQQARGFSSTLDALRGYELFEDDAWDTDFEHSGTGRPPAGEATLYVET